MIIWINGAFGSGKTQTAHELHRRIPDSFIYDPENAGYFIQRNLPAEMKLSDFQDYPMWREFNYSMLRNISKQYTGHIIVPMTIVNPQYFAEIVGRLRSDGVVVHHFALCADRKVLIRRLRSRAEGANSWAAQQIDRCIEGLSNPIFEFRLDTNLLSTDDVVTRIASMLDIPLQPDHRGGLRKKYDRWITQLKYIRFFS